MWWILPLSALSGVLYYRCKELKKELDFANQMVEDMINGGSESEPESMGYMWLSGEDRVWTKFQPKRTSMIYMSKKDYLELIGRKYE